MASAACGLATVNAHAGRTDRPIEAGMAMRDERSSKALGRVRLSGRGGAHRHRAEHPRIELGLPLFLGR